MHAKKWFPSNEMHKSPNLINEPIKFILYLVLPFSWGGGSQSNIFSFFVGLRSSARNIFIASLAFADLILCVFNMPLTLVLTLTKSWPFYSDSWFFCKSILTLQACTQIYV